MMSLREIARILGGEISNGQVLAPGPGHNKSDRSLCIKLSASAPDGFIVHSFASDDPIICKDYVRQLLGLPAFKPNGERTAVYEYRDPATGAVRYRKERIESADGNKTFVIKPKGRGGSGPLFYGGERIADLAEGQPVFIVEGEKKVDRLRALGAIAVSLDAGAKSKWRQEHAQLLRGLRIIFWPDSDEPGETYIRNAAAALLAEDPAFDLRVVRPFGLPNGAKGRDVCDWTGGAEELVKLAEAAEPYVPPPRTNGEAAENPVKLLSYDEMTVLPPVDWGVHGVWPRRAKSVLYGPSDSFKSLLACDLACSASTGRSWHGYAVKQFRVIYIANEGANAVGRKRIPAWMAYHDIPSEQRQNIFLVKVDVTLPDETSRANLLAAIRTIVTPGEDFGVVIDVLRGTMTGSESDDECAHAWTRAAETLIQEGAAILTVTHSPYGDDGRMRGSSHLWGSFDTRLHVEGNKEQRTAILKVNRHKDHDSGGQWGFKLEEQEVPEHPGETSLVPRLDSEVRPSTQGRRLPDSAALHLDALIYSLDEMGAFPPASEHIPRNVKCVTIKQWQSYVEKRTGGTLGDKDSSERRAFFRAKDRLQREKLIGIWGTYVWVTKGDKR